MILSLSGGAWECAFHIPEDRFVLDVEWKDLIKPRYQLCTSALNIYCALWTELSGCAKTKASISCSPHLSLLWAISWADPAAKFKETTVHLRIEGKDKTIFERPVSTCGHRVTTRSGGTHHCNGTNNDRYPCAGPTCITALDDASKVAEFGFDG